MAKNQQEGDYEERVVAKSKPVRNLVSTRRPGSPTVPSSTASSSLGNFAPRDHELWVTQSTGQLVSQGGQKNPAKSDAVEDSPVIVLGAHSMKGAGAPVGWGSDQTVNSQQSTWQLVAENSVTENDLEMEKEYDILSAVAMSLREKVFGKIRSKLVRPAGTEMEEIERHSLIQGLFLASSMQEAIFLRQDFFEYLRSVTNTDQKPTVQKLFDVTKKLIGQQKLEISYSGELLRGRSCPW